MDPEEPKFLEANEASPIAATIIRGHQVASGKSEDPRFPGGTLAMQLPHFRERGLYLSRFYLSTLNLSIAPLRYKIIGSKHTFRKVAWHPTEPAEDFSFFDCRFRTADSDTWIGGLIYHPHPETKPDHFQPPDMLEVIAERFIEGIGYEDRIFLLTDPAQIRFLDTETQ